MRFGIKLGDGQEICIGSYLLHSQIQELVAHDDLTKRPLRLFLFEKGQSKNTGVKANISESQGKLKLESNLDQFEYEDIEEDQPAENLSTNLNMEDKTD